MVIFKIIIVSLLLFDLPPSYLYWTALLGTPQLKHTSDGGYQYGYGGDGGDDGGGARGAARVCKCLAAWKGDSCGVLNLAPATPGAGFHAPTEAASNMSSWGGAIVYDAGGGGGDGGGGPPNDGRWIMYANEMVGGCGINTWESNSRVR